MTTIDEATSCSNRELVNDVTIPDESNLLNVEIIQDLWRYFRLNNSVSLKSYPEESHLKVTITEKDIEMYKQLYTSVFEPLFLSLIQFDHGQILVHINNRKDTGLIIGKHENDFTLYEINITRELFELFTTITFEISQKMGYFGRLVSFLLFKCDSL